MLVLRVQKFTHSFCQEYFICALQSVSIPMIPVFLFLLCAFHLSLCDQGVYVDTSAIEQNQDLLISQEPTIVFTIRTSNTYLGGTADPVVATIVGEFSSSGPHSVGPMDVGSTVVVPVVMERNVGKLRKLILENNSTDGWLPMYVQCVHDNELYEFDVPRHWLSTQPSEALIQPNTHLLHEIPSFPIMHLMVSANAPIYPKNP